MSLFLKNFKFLSTLSLTVSLILMKMGGSDVSLSAKTWPPDGFDRMKRKTLNRFERLKPLAVKSGKGLMAGTTEPFAVH